MGSSTLNLFNLLLVHSCFHLIQYVIVIGSSSFGQQPVLCRDDESLALLQFKQSFSIYENASITDPFAYPKTASWKLEESSNDCCSWDGVECDQNTGHVIGLDLGSSCLYGSINSSSSLFRLLHLQKLNLAFNHFNYSHIPSTISHLSRLTDLNLSNSVFSGQIPSKISELCWLASLDLRNNVDPSSFESLLKLEKHNLNSILQNLTHLEKLHLNSVNISSVVPGAFGNSTSLISLRLKDCGLHGEFLTSVFQLPNLQVLGLSFNPYLKGYLPEFNKSNPLKTLYLKSTSFSGKLPDSIGNLNSLKDLVIGNCNFSGSVPSSLANLTQLTTIDLSSNNFVNLNNFVINLSNASFQNLKYLGLAACNLSEFPNFLRHQTELELLVLHDNKIHGKIPKWIWNVGKETMQGLSVYGNFLTGFDQPPIVLPWTTLKFLDLSFNMLQGSLLIPPLSTLFYSVSNNLLTGEISPLICNLHSLHTLDLSNNNFSGMLPPRLSNFMHSLLVLDLRNNSFHGNIPQTCTAGSELRMLDLSRNRLQGQLPRSLANCKKLEFLDLGNNKISDTFPLWLGTSPELRILILQSNEFHGPIMSPETMLKFPNLHIIDLSYNSFCGMFPYEYINHWSAMKIVDAEHWAYMQANMNFHFSIDPSRQYYFAYSMKIANKGVETIYGRIPEILVAIDLSSNKFEGDIPGSIGNLKGLQLLNLSNNLFSGPIPSNLGNLTELESLDLSQNMLSGEIPQQLVELTFLEFLNVSHNHLVGPIPQGKQFDTFENSSFEGNSGLCGKPLPKKCGKSEVSPFPPLTFQQGKESKFPSGYDWLFIVMGYGSGLVVGLVIGHTITTKRHHWFIESFGRSQGKRREKRRGQRSRT